MLAVGEAPYGWISGEAPAVGGDYNWIAEGLGLYDALAGRRSWSSVPHRVVDALARFARGRRRAA
jgi:hypothetical protein